MHCRSEIKTSIKVKEDPEGAYTEITVKTTDRPGLLTDIVHNMKDININVISAEVWPPLQTPAPLSFWSRLSDLDTFVLGTDAILRSQ